MRAGKASVRCRCNAMQCIVTEATTSQGARCTALCCSTLSFVEGLEVAVLASVSACKSARVESHGCTVWSVAARSVLEEPACGWHDCVPGLHPPAYKHQAQRKLCDAGMKLLPAVDMLVRGSALPT